MNIQLKALNQDLERFRIKAQDKHGKDFMQLTVGGWFKYLQLKGIVKGDITKEAKTISDLKFRICDTHKFAVAENWKRQLDDELRKIEYAKRESLKTKKL